MEQQSEKEVDSGYVPLEELKEIAEEGITGALYKTGKKRRPKPPGRGQSRKRRRVELRPDNGD